MNYSKEEIVSIHEADKVSDLPDKITKQENLKNLYKIDIPEYLKQSVDRNELRNRFA